MNRPRTASRLLAPALVLLGCGPAAAQDAAAPTATPAAPPAKVALLVGIDEYARGTSRDFPDLSGCANDVRRVHEVLVERFDFDPANIRVLLNEQATHEAIVRSFHEWLIDRAGPETEVVYWFSGHGSRVEDASGVENAETEGRDSTFVAYDSRVGDLDGSYDIPDDALRSLILALTRKTSKVTIVTDACHSGGAVRGHEEEDELPHRSASPGTKALRFEQIAGFWPETVPWVEDGGQVELSPSRYVHIAACGPRQLANEERVTGEDGEVRVHGALTYYLTDALVRADHHATFRRLADEASVRVSTRHKGQTVWYEGALDRVLFDARFEERPRGFLARAEERGGRARIALQGGRIHGLRAGSELEILRNTSGERLGLARVSQLHTGTAVAEWVPEHAPEEPPEGSLRAVEVTRPGGRDPLRVQVEDEALRALLADCPTAELTADPAPYRLVREGGRVTLIDPDGLKIWREEPPRGEESAARRDRRLRREIETELREELRFQSLYQLALDPGTVRLDCRFVPPNDVERATYEGYGDATGGAVSAENGALAAGGELLVEGGGVRDDLKMIVLEIENTHEQPLYVSVLSIVEDRSRNLVWPHEGQRDAALLEAGSKLRVPVQVVTNESWTLERPMRDRYLVFATTTFADFSPFQRGSGLTRSSNPMPGVLMQALDGPVHRGARKSRTRGADPWGVTVTDLLVR